MAAAVLVVTASFALGNEASVGSSRSRSRSGRLGERGQRWRRLLGLPGRLLPEERHGDERAARRRVRRARERCAGAQVGHPDGARADGEQRWRRREGVRRRLSGACVRVHGFFLVQWYRAHSGWV